MSKQCAFTSWLILTDEGTLPQPPDWEDMRRYQTTPQASLLKHTSVRRAGTKRVKKPMQGWPLETQAEKFHRFETAYQRIIVPLTCPKFSVLYKGGISKSSS